MKIQYLVLGLGSGVLLLQTGGCALEQYLVPLLVDLLVSMLLGGLPVV